MSSTSPGVPGFETISVLADGPSTIVRARSLDDGGEVIVKLLDPASEPLLPRRFDRRRRALLKLSAPGQGFAPLLGHGIAGDGRPYVVLPHIPLGSLQDQLDRGPTSWFTASQLMAKVAEAVGRAHEEEAPLGDLRPSKILLRGADVPLVAAFGMASRRFDDGRPSYRAPEAHNDSPPTAPADVFSLALVLATLIAGRAKDRKEPIGSFLAELVGLAPARIHEVLEHGLAESVTNRYGSGAAMHRALARAVAEAPEQPPEDAVESDPSDPVELDDLLPAQAPLAPAPEVREAPATADGLPPDLDDLVLASAQPERTVPPDHHDADATIEDDRLLLPAGLDDIVLAEPVPVPPPEPWTPLIDDETNPFPSEERTQSSNGSADRSHGGLPLAIIDLAATAPADVTLDQESGAGTDHSVIGDHPAIDDHDCSGDHDDTAHRDDDDGDDPIADDRLTEVGPAADQPDAEPSESAADERVDEPAGDQPSGDQHEIVDLTELFTRTHEFVYDPAIHGPGDRPTDDGSRSGEHPPVRPPGDQRGSEPTSTTTLVRGTDAVPVMESDGATSAEVPPVTPAPPQMPARAASPHVDDDSTDIFPETDDSTGPPWVDDGVETEGQADTTPPFLDLDRSEAIPFPNMGRVRNRVDDHRWQARARTWAAMLWFRSRRTISTVLALLGLLAIVAIVVLFAAREIRSATTSIDTEGAPQPLTTATTGANFVSTDAPFITDVPPSFRPTTATPATARRRVTTTKAPTTTSPPITRTTTTPTTAATTRPPTSQVTTSTMRPTTVRSTTTRRRRTTRTTVVTTIPSTQTTAEILPTSSDDDDDDTGGNDGGNNGNDGDNGNDGSNGNNGRRNRGRGAQPPDLSPPALVSLSETSASVTYSSDACVATRFRLSGTDGSVQSGSSRGYEASIQCSTAWNLDFSGSSELSSGVGYTLRLTIKGPSGQTTAGRLDFTTPA